MDNIDVAILDHLEADYRTPLIEIAGSVGIARSTAKRRINSLFQRGCFEGYQIEVNRLSLGLDRLAYLEVKTNPREAWLLKAIESLDQCVESNGVIGEYGLVFKMLFRDGSELADRLHALDSLIASSAAKRYRIIDIIETYKERNMVHRVVSRRNLDGLDRALLGILIDQRSPSPRPLWKLAQHLQRELNRRVSKSTVQKRIQRMVDLGIICRFTIRPRRWYRDPGIHALIRLKTDPGQTRSIATDVIIRMPEVLCLYRTGEDYGLFAEVFVSGLESLDMFIKTIYRIEGVIDTMTTIVVERRKEVPVPVGSLIQG